MERKHSPEVVTAVFGVCLGQAHSLYFSQSPHADDLEQWLWCKIWVVDPKAGFHGWQMQLRVLITPYTVLDRRLDQLRDDQARRMLFPRKCHQDVMRYESLRTTVDISSHFDPRIWITEACVQHKNDAMVCAPASPVCARRTWSNLIHLYKTANR